NMELSDYIEASIYSVLKGLHNADKRLQDEQIGHIWKGDFNTISTDLVGLKIAKGQKEGEQGSTPVLVFDFDINVMVNDSSAESSSTDISASAKLLNVISFKGGVEAGSESSSSKMANQNLKFSVPVSFQDKA
ncbi:hypothetical protein AB8289_004695, partial [Vibrio parahaemolyticus]